MPAGDVDADRGGDPALALEAARIVSGRAGDGNRTDGKAPICRRIARRIPSKTMAKRFRLSVLNNWTSVFLTAVERGGNALPHPATLFAILSGVRRHRLRHRGAHRARGGPPGHGRDHPAGQPAHRRRPAPHPGRDGHELHQLRAARHGARLDAGDRRDGSQRPDRRGPAPARAVGAEAAADVRDRPLGRSSPTRPARSGYVLLVPLGGIIFLGAGRHPIAGLAAAFAGVSGGLQRQPAARHHRSAARRPVRGSGPDRPTGIRRQPRRELLPSWWCRRS